MNEQERVILAIDLKSFYASVECVYRGLDPFSVPLVVADDSRGDGTIVLAASPYIKKKYGVKSRCRLYEVPKDIPGLLIAPPNMALYLKVSAAINDLYLDYVDRKDLYVYSIDESFLDCTRYLSCHRDTPRSYAEKILKDVRHRTGLTVTAGIGTNLFMAKAAMDIEAKHREDCLAQWDASSIPEHLWPVAPLSKMWGIGSRLEKKLNAWGFHCVGDIAVCDRALLKRRIGTIGEEIYEHAWGRDDAVIQNPYQSPEHTLSVGQVLLRDYSREEMPTVIRDMADELSDRLYEESAWTASFALYVGYKDHTGFGRKFGFELPTRDRTRIGREAVNAFLRSTPLDSPFFREVSLLAFDVYPADGPVQLSLFSSPHSEEEEENLTTAVREIRRRYGVAKAMPLRALTLSSTFLARQSQIGGHQR